MLGIAAHCRNLLHSVPKLMNSKARFPFFVRQVFIFGLECVQMYKVSHRKSAQNGLQNGPEIGPQLDFKLDDGKRPAVLGVVCS